MWGSQSEVTNYFITYDSQLKQHSVRANFVFFLGHVVFSGSKAQLRIFFKKKVEPIKFKTEIGYASKGVVVIVCVLHDR